MPTRLLYSVRTSADVVYADELNQLAGSGDGFALSLTFTRQAPGGWTGYRRRIDRAMLSEVAGPLGEAPLVYVCGPTLFVEAAANNLVALGIAPARIRTERFGPTGGAEKGV